MNQIELRGAPGVRRRYVDVGSGQVHVREAGADRGSVPLLCLHMSPASSIVFETFAGTMGLHRHVIAADTPGYGQSDAPGRQPTFEDYGRFAEQLVESIAVDGPIDVLGYHTGSFIAVELAARRPDLVRQIVAFSLPIFTETDLQHFRPLYGPTPLFEPTGESLRDKWRWFVDFYGATDPDVDLTLDEAARLFVSRLAGIPNQWWAHAALFDYDVAPRLADLTTPLTVLNLDDDVTALTWRAAEHLAPGRLIDATHWRPGFLDHHTEAVVELINDLLDHPTDH